ncbi:MAG: prepilin-type N-terminal cleavage/methylation domain-containing protein [Planctomycetota bacterium]
MTLVTGKSKNTAASQVNLKQRIATGVGPGTQGFTMVELLVTIALIVFLMSMLAMNSALWIDSATSSRTSALISGLSLFIDEYHSTTGDYPSDGLDGRDVITSDGTYLTGGAALTYALTQPLLITSKVNGEIRVIDSQPPVGDFRSSELSSPSDGDADAYQLLDAWGEAIHYDNVSAGEKYFSAQSLGETHLDWDDDNQIHSEDPRELGEGTQGIGPQNNNEYDIWSHGSNGHSEDESYEDLITNWQGGGQ